MSGEPVDAAARDAWDSLPLDTVIEEFFQHSGERVEMRVAPNVNIDSPYVKVNGWDVVFVVDGGYVTREDAEQAMRHVWKPMAENIVKRVEN